MFPSNYAFVENGKVILVNNMISQSALNSWKAVYPSALYIDIQNHPQRDQVIVGWEYNSTTGDFSEPDLDSVSLEYNKNLKASSIDSLLSAENLKPFVLSSGSSLSLTQDILDYLVIERVKALVSGSLSASFVSPLDAITKLAISVPDMAALDDILEAILEQRRTNIARWKELKVYLWSSAVTKQSQIDAINWTMTIPA